jgi:hypothetical protein
MYTSSLLSLLAGLMYADLCKYSWCASSRLKWWSANPQRVLRQPRSPPNVREECCAHQFQSSLQ